MWEQSQHFVAGVQEDKLELVAKDFIDYTDKVNNIFQRLKLLVDDLKFGFDCEEGEIFRNVMQKQSLYYPIVVQNFLSYASDFVKIKNFYEKKVSDIVDILADKK